MRTWVSARTKKTKLMGKVLFFFFLNEIRKESDCIPERGVGGEKRMGFESTEEIVARRFVGGCRSPLIWAIKASNYVDE